MDTSVVLGYEQAIAVGVEAAGRAEVDDLGVSLGIYENVELFQVPMHDFVAPKEIDTLENLSGCLQEIELTPSPVRFGEAALIELHENAMISIIVGKG